MNDIDLLRVFEPIVRYTEGELFFPCAVDEYVKRCSLLLREGTRGHARRVLVPEGELTLDRLAEEGARDPSRSLCLWFIREPLHGRAYRQWLRRPDRPHFSTTGRLARVGLWARFIDSLFTLSLFVRGSVPGGTTAAAEQCYREMQAVASERVYHGRVVRHSGYIVLQYIFFYVMNDWRSTFFGVNDHEADWEQIFVYLNEEGDGTPRPVWVAYASHDFAGDDLRRRWDDPELTLEGNHPVVFAGAGSHASYFKPGEYLTSVRLSFLNPVLSVIRVLRGIWSDILRQGESDEFVRQVEGLLSIPFVDYARGDGRAIGPGQADTWTPVLLTEDLGWVEDYRGLWGLDTRDPLSGEIAPSGPKYQRDGSIRQSWYDPIGWSGLEKVAPPPVQEEVLADRIAQLERELAELEQQLSAIEVDLARQELEVRSLYDIRYLSRLHRRREQELSRQETERNLLNHRRIEIIETLAACRRQLQALQFGDLGDPRAHLHHTHEPQPPDTIRQSRIAETWAGLSIGVLLLGGVLVMLIGADNWIVALATLVAAVIVVENIIHRSMMRLLLNLTITLALICTAVLLYQFFWYLALVAVAALAIVILRDNIRELRRF